jgi:hypothetical protein
MSLNRFFLKQNLVWIFMILVSYPVLFLGCGGSGGNETDETSTANVYDPSRDYYDQLWDIASREALTPAMTEPEIAEALARWIVNNSTNARSVPEDSLYPLPDGARGSDDELLPFHGLCGDRSLLFEYLGMRAGLTVSVFNIYNFSGPGAGHTCVQVFYENDWHFYDVTYAGIFIANDKVMSFAEMRNDPVSAIEGMVVFTQTGDIRDYFSNGLPVDNIQRMHNVYNEEDLTNAISTSFLGSGNLVPLKVLIDLSLLPIYVGDLSGTSSDLDIDGGEQNISNCLGVMLGYVWDNFEPVITISNAIPGQTYSLRFYIYYATTQGLTFQIGPTKDVEIVSGNQFTTTDDMTGSGINTIWEIRFRPQAQDVSFTVQHDCGEGNGLLSNYITVESVN